MAYSRNVMREQQIDEKDPLHAPKRLSEKQQAQSAGS
jgi:hypothetical protein